MLTANNTDATCAIKRFSGDEMCEVSVSFCCQMDGQHLKDAVLRFRSHKTVFGGITWTDSNQPERTAAANPRRIATIA